MSGDHSELTLGQVIRNRREELGLSLTDVAAHSALDASYWSKLENDRVKAPAPRTLQAVAQTLNTDTADLYALCGYEVPERLPDFQPYLRAKYELPPQAVADLERYFTQLRHYYGIPENKPVFPPRKLAASTDAERRAKAAVTRAQREREQLVQAHLDGDLPHELFDEAMADNDVRLREARQELEKFTTRGEESQGAPS
jgi:transcriptional regulator with XRE-family HTH domain